MEMKTAKRYSRLRMLLVSVCALFGCVLFALGFALPQSVFAADESAGGYELTKILLSQKEGYSFTADLTDPQKYDLVEVVVTYTEVLSEGSEGTPDSFTEKLTLSGTDSERNAATGEVVKFSFSGNTIFAEVTPREGYATAENLSAGSLSVTFVNREVSGIVAEYAGTGELTTASELYGEDFIVYWEYNNGTRGRPLSSDQYQPNVNLFPDKIMPIGEKYDKAVEIATNEAGDAEYGKHFTTTALVKGITFCAPDSVMLISGTFATQSARSDRFNTGNLTVTLVYNGNGIIVPLNLFDNRLNGGDFAFTFRKSQGGEILSGLTTEVKYCTMTFTFPGTTDKSVSRSARLDVVPISVAAPTFPDEGVISYYNGVGIDIAGLDFSKSGYGDPYFPTPSVEVTCDGKESDFQKPTTYEDTYHLIFKKPDISYTVTVTLVDSENKRGGDFQWQAPDSRYAVRSEDGYSITYTVRVNKGNWDITLAGDFSWIYGEQGATGSVKGDLRGTSENENQSFAYTPNAVDDTVEVTGYEYHLEYSDGGIWSAVVPEDAGKYRVRAKAHSTEFYNPAQSNVLDVTISPKKLSAQDFVKSVTYDGTTYDGTAILEDTVDGIAVSSLGISVTTASGGSFSAKYFNTADANGYEAALTLGNTNYVFQELPETWNSVADLVGQRTDSAYFLIKKRAIQYTVSQGSFAYGTPSDISANPVDLSDEKYLTTPAVSYTGKGTHTDRTDIRTWDAGNYTVVYTPVYGGTDKREENSLELLASDPVSFTIGKAQIRVASIPDQNMEFDPAGRVFTVRGLADAFAAGGLGKYKDLTQLLKGTVTGTRDGFTAKNFELGTDDVQIALRDADVYTVKIVLADADNFVWTGGGADPEGIWTITKKSVAEVAAPTAEITYDHTAHVLTLAEFDKDLMTQSVTGVSASQKTLSAVFDEENKTVSLTNAGVYTFTFRLRDAGNYKWENETSDTLTFTFTLKQATAALLEKEGETDFKDNETKYFVLPKARSAKDGSELLTLSFIFNITDEDGTEIATQANAATTAITASGVYQYTVTGLSGAEADNYTLNGGTLLFTYTVKSQNLPVPTFKTGNQLTYSGAKQSVLEFFNDYSVGTYGDRIVITIYKGQGGDRVSSGADPTVTNVYFADNAVKEYYVTVRPSENYKWAAGKEDEVYSFTFTMEQFGLKVTWRDGTLTSVYGGTVDPGFDLNTQGAGTGVTALIGYKDKDKNVLSAAPSSAGNYYVFATGLSGADKDNYFLSVNPDTEYVVTKQTIAKPTLSKTYEAVFGTSESGNLYSNQAMFNSSLLTASVEGYRPAAWFGFSDEEHNQKLTLGTETYFALASGKFFYRDAGYYKVTFTINDGTNCCWVGDDDRAFTVTEYAWSWNDFAKIGRKTLTAPAFGNNRAQEWDKFDPDHLKVTVPIDGVAVNVQYGTRSGNSSSGYVYNGDLDTAVKGSAAVGAIGQYYILVEIVQSGNIDILNYVWGDSADGLRPFVAGEDTKTYKIGQVAIYLHYAITSSQLPLSFNEIEYTFGDNGKINGADPKYSGLFSVLSLKEGSLGLLQGAEMDWNTTDIAFVENSIKFYLNGREVTDLENGLPWGAENYTVSFEISFSNRNYQNLPVSGLAVKVARRAIELEWSDLSKVYSGEQQFGSVRMINVPQRESVATQLPVLTVSARDKSEVKDAGNYSLYVSDISGENENNFTVTGAKNHYSAVQDSSADVPFEITRYAFTAKAKDVSDHVYGEALAHGVSAWTVSGDTNPRPVGFDSDITNIILKVMQGEAVFEKPSVGSYTLALEWKSEYAGRNYQVNFDNTATLKVVPRRIEVALLAKEGQTLTGNRLTSVYYSDATDYTVTDYRFSATYNGSADNAIVTGDSPFRLRSSVTQTSAENANGYSVTVRVTDANYIVTVLGTAYSQSETAADTGYLHAIDPAQLKPSVEKNNDVVYNANPHAFLKGNTATGSNLSVNRLRWWIAAASEGASAPAENSGDWQEYNAATHAGTDAGKYYFFVKATADNHVAAIVSDNGKPFCFEIGKAAFTNLNRVASRSPVYNAQPYPYLSGHTVQGVNLAENNLVWYIGKAASESASAGSVAWEVFDAEKHARTDAGKEYFFVKITADNHNDLTVTEAAGKPFCLDIQKATLTLSADMEIFFNEKNPADAGYYMDGGAVTVGKLKEGYKKVFFITGWQQDDEAAFTGGTLAGLDGSFTYSANYTKGVSGADASYPITLTSDLSSANYLFGITEGTLRVKRLPVSASVPANLTSVYGATGLSMPVATVSSEQVSTYGGTAKIDISDLAVSTIVTVRTDALVGENAPYTTNDVGQYDITLHFGDNFVLIENGYQMQSYQITPAKNIITTADYELFEDAVSWKEGSSVSATPAWVYGEFAQDGYKADGKNALKEFALLSRDNALKITLAYLGKDGWSKDVTVSASDVIAEKLAGLFRSVDNFGAGSYTVTYHMDASKNYEPFNEVWNFTVAKRGIEVTPDPQSVVYGEEFTDTFTYRNDLLDGYGAREEITVIVPDFRFATVRDGVYKPYEKGWDFGTYDIKVLIGGALAEYDGDSFGYETDNYAFTFLKSGFNVTARTVTLTINNAWNRYMLVGDYDEETQTYALEDWASLTYKIADDSMNFYGGVPFTLHTTALVDRLTTKNVGEYAIYAQFTDATAKSNYNIVIANGEYSSDIDKTVLTDADEDLIITKDGKLCGGVFEVKKAELTAERIGPYYRDPDGTAEFGGVKYTLYTTNDGVTYDGKEKYYFATTRVDRADLQKLLPTFTPIYTKVGDAAFSGIPKNVGEYRVTFAPESGNANFADLKIRASSFQIYARELSVASSLTGGNVLTGNTATYNGNPYNVTFTFETVVGDEVLGLDVKVNGKDMDDLVTKPQPGALRNVLKLTATEADIYAVTVRLSGAGMENYRLGDGVYAYTLVINAAGLYVVIQNAEIEYGTTLVPNSLFHVAYSLTNDKATETDPELLRLIQTNIDNGDFPQPSQFHYVVSNGSDGSAAYSDGIGGAASRAGTEFNVSVDNLKPSNYTVTIVSGKLTVKERNIRVYVYGVADNADRGTDIAHSVYDGRDHSTQSGGTGAFQKNYLDNKTTYLEVKDADAFGNSGKQVKDLEIMLSIGTAVNAERYPIYAADNDPNFAIAFYYGENVFTDTNRPRYEIDRKTLIAKVQGAGTTYEQQKSTVNVVYGNEAAQSLFTVCYDGWVPGQESLGRTSPVLIGEADATYRAYESQVGQTFNVRIDSASSGIYAGTGTYANYNVVLTDATLAITPRPIGATTEARTFEADTAEYHGGAWGKPLEAQITFSNVDVQSRLNGAYTLSYDTKENLALGQSATTAPVRVGDYRVTVAISPNSIGDGKTYYNYTFSGTNPAQRTCELNYSIEKRNVNLVWSSTTVNEVTSVTLNGGFVADVMDVVSFTRGENALGDSEYSASNNGLSIEVGSVNGFFTITVALKATATHNYQLTENVSGSMRPVDQRVASFTVALGSNQTTYIKFITAGMGSWTYSESAKEPRAQVRLQSSHELVSGAVIIFDYVPVTSAPANAELNAEYDSVDGWEYDNTRWRAVVSDAGRYLVRARYAGQTAPETYYAANPVYFYFEIAQKRLAKPLIKDADSYVYAEQNGAGYIEGEIENYDPSAMQIVSSDVQATLSGGSMKLVATGKGEYSIRIALTDDANYVWADSTEGGADLTWTVRPASDNQLVWNDGLQSTAYAESYSLSANPQKYRYNIRLNYSYAARGEEAEPSENAVWTNGFPVNAGKYWIRAVGSSPEGNYNDASIDLAFEITKVTLTLDPTGSMTYGETFAQTMNAYTVSGGLVNGDTEQMIMRDLKNVTYTVTNAPESGLWAAGNYRLAMTAEATNYTIVSLTGTFSVNKARLYVTIGNNASSLYKQALNLDQTRISLRGTVAGDDESALVAELKAAFVCAATSVSDADRYEIGLSVTELANYTLSVTNGVYTINKLPVRVEVDWGGYDYGATAAKLPSVTNVYDGNVKLTLTQDELKDFLFVYAGFDSVPTAAGEHIASVRIADDSNYTLASPVSGLFVIRQIELDAELIVWETVCYDTVIKKPEILRIDGDFDESMFDISYEGEWNRAGVAYTIVLTLRRPDSTKWKTVEGAVRTLAYTVSRGANALVEPIAIEGWTYGGYSEANLPVASAKFGTVTFEYSASRESGYTTAAPVGGDAGEYWVRAVVEGTSDYERFVSPAVKFEITKKAISAPSLGIITEGYGQNDVYTGMAMQADVLSYDSTLMYIRYEDGTMIVNGNQIKVIATNAGTYHVTVTLVNGNNYGWAEGTPLDNDGNALLTWTIRRKKVAKPEHNDATLIVNGQILTYYPIGFDPSIMSIENNTSGYGGTFKAEISLIDTENYEWSTGSTDSFTLEWHVVGADSVFAVVMSILSVLAVAAAVAGGVEGYLYYKKKKEEKNKAQKSGETKEGI